MPKLIAKLIFALIKLIFTDKTDLVAILGPNGADKSTANVENW